MSPSTGRMEAEALALMGRKMRAAQSLTHDTVIVCDYNAYGHIELRINRLSTCDFYTGSD